MGTLSLPVLYHCYSILVLYGRCGSGNTGNSCHFTNLSPYIKTENAVFICEKNIIAYTFSIMLSSHEIGFDCIVMRELDELHEDISYIVEKPARQGNPVLYW